MEEEKGRIKTAPVLEDNRDSRVEIRAISAQVTCQEQRIPVNSEGRTMTITKGRKSNIETQIRGFLVAAHGGKPLLSLLRCPPAPTTFFRGPAVDLPGMFTAFTGVFLDAIPRIQKNQFSTRKQQGSADNYLSADS